jgi:RND family efflux transporter MFP subunit
MTAGSKAKLIISALFIVIVLLFVVRFMALKGRTTALSIEEIQAAEGIPVDVMILEKGSIDRYLELLGEIQGIEQVEIVSALGIDITEIVKRDGERVKKGDVVVRLARDRAGNAYHQYSLAEQAYENARRDVGRMENMFKEGAVSEQLLEQARLNFRNANAQLQQARSMVDLVSPINGVVTRVDATEGTAAVPGMPLVTIASTGQVRVRCFVGQDEIGLLRTGQPAEICLTTLTAGGEERCKVQGTVHTVSLSADAASKLFLTEVIADNADGTLRAGLVASVKILVEKNEDVLTIPEDALVRRAESDFLYLIKQGFAVMTPVERGVSNGERIALSGSIAEGDTFVVRGQFKLTDGKKVRINELLTK